MYYQFVTQATSIPNNVDFRSKIGGQGTDWWTVYSVTQVQTYGLWCQVVPADNMNMGSNIGDWYYPPGNTPDGFALVPTTSSNTVPYRSMKCTNQIGLAVDGVVTNNQGFVRCTTTITGLNRQSNYFVVYSDSVFTNYSKSFQMAYHCRKCMCCFLLTSIDGPNVDANMEMYLLSPRNTETNIMLSLRFNVSFGPPSMVHCVYGNNVVVVNGGSSRGTSVLQLSREVIRSHFSSNSEPDMTQVSIEITQTRVPRTYTCTVTVEGRVNIDNPNMYDFANKGSGSTTVSITGECVTAVLILLLTMLVLFSVLGTPTGVTASRTGYNSIRVTWTAPSTGTPPAGYEVFYQSTGSSAGNTSDTELTLTNLAVGSYSMYVVGFGAEGDPVLPSARSQTTSNIMIGIIKTCTRIIESLLIMIVFRYSSVTICPNPQLQHQFCQCVMVSYTIHS